MADLLDIAASTAVESVKTEVGFIVVHGLHGEAIASIVARFPNLAALLDGNSAEFGPRLIAHFGNAVAPIIAAGCGHIGNAEYEQAAAKYLVEDQLKLIAAIIRLTFPNGLSSFVKTMMELLSGTDERAKPIKMRLKQSPLPSQPSSVEDSHPNMQCG